MTDSNQKIVKALLDGQARAKGEAEMKAHAEKHHAVIQAVEVIYEAVTNWTGIEVTPSERIPIIRNGKRVGELPQSLFAINPVREVAEASLVEDTGELKRKLDNLRAVFETSEALAKALGKMTFSERSKLDVHGLRNRNDLQLEPSLEARIIHEIGLTFTTFLSSKALFDGAKKEIEELESKLRDRNLGRGRPRNEAAHSVAQKLAQLYAKVTGRRPTYSAGPDGFHGEFTPALRKVFDTLGWSETDLSGPAQKAIESIDESVLMYGENNPASLNSILSSEWTHPVEF
ncbi:MAG: hypothetical protein K8F59_11005 [Rhodobacteraceae bacterium]|nr:hypothetical protein [Paracoccaceae bacterium]